MATGTISSIGLGSGLDANTIISKLMEIEKAPLLQVQSQASVITSKISAVGTIQSDLSALGDAANKLIDPALWKSTLATSADPSTISVVSSSSAAAGSYAVSVQQLAAAQATVSPAYESPDSSVGSGTLTIQFGSLDGPPTAFTARTTLAAINISVLSTDTVSTLAAKINASGSGVSASVVTDKSGARLIISGNSTGTDNAFKVTAQDDGTVTGGATLTDLAVDPSLTTGQASSVTQLPTDAEATVNGLAVTSQSNQLDHVITGLTMNLLKVTPSGTTTNADGTTTTGAAPTTSISVASDTASMKAAVQALVTAFNALSTEITTDTAYDVSTKKASVLTGDSTVRTIQTQLRNILSASSAASSVYSTLSSAGVQFARDAATGEISLAIDDKALTAALSTPAEAKKLFANSTTDGSADGFARQVNTFTHSMLGADGLVTARSSGLKAQLESNEKRQSDLSTLNDATEARLKAQYNALDSKMASLNALSTYVTQQVTAWNKNTS